MSATKTKIELHEKPTSPWFHAVAASSDRSFSRASYITPEDISASVKAGAEPLALATEVLDAIGRGAAEDVKLCAFVAYKAIRGAMRG
jgi:hypothetical protein